MAQAFRRDGDRIVSRLRAHEVAMLRGLVEDVQRLVAADAAPNPMTARLFPDPSLDPEVSADLRGMIQDDLREAKRAAARAVLGSLPDDGRLSLDAETADQWLTALNDLRLALGTALGVTEDDEESDEPDYDVYQWLGFLLESLVAAVSAGVDR